MVGEEMGVEGMAVDLAAATVERVAASVARSEVVVWVAAPAVAVAVATLEVG
jgi:MinD superfamily P-loop ATPase